MFIGSSRIATMCALYRELTSAVCRRSASARGSLQLRLEDREIEVIDGEQAERDRPDKKCEEPGALAEHVGRVGPGRVLGVVDIDQRQHRQQESHEQEAAE